MNFGMEGADIVAGSVDGGIRSLYAETYVGEPVPDSSLQIFSPDVNYKNNRVHLSFSRPLSGGYLSANFDIDASITSGYSDIIWAVGADSTFETASGCDYHENRRGLRPIDWANPEEAMLDAWKC